MKAFLKHRINIGFITNIDGSGMHEHFSKHLAIGHARLLREGRLHSNDVHHIYSDMYVCTPEQRGGQAVLRHYACWGTRAIFIELPAIPGACLQRLCRRT